MIDFVVPRTATERALTMAILEERGLFWWADEPVPEKQFAPDSCLAGLLTISDDGQTRLELDGYFPSKHGPMTPIARSGFATRF